jgi:hypothetical protein
MTTISKSGYGAFEDGANSVAARLRMTYEVWGVASTWTIKARSLLEAVSMASEELSVRSYAGFIVSVRPVDANPEKHINQFLAAPGAPTTTRNC